ncbi:isoprenylcysteine carboxyl methyltransferase [Fragilaria crotonensis]|nr:isoprenylcysteine carboxyl methyltransferase [Fragilaria crotonensis]
MKLFNHALCLASVGAFAPTTSRRSNIKVGSPSFPLQMAETPFAGLQDKVQELMGSLKSADGLNFDIDAVKTNIMDGEFGSRGETYTVAQFALLGCIVGGGIPIIGDVVMFLLGPGLLLAGAALLIVSLSDLGDSLSPWPVPPSGGNLRTDGVYSEMRHPMYAGSLAAAAGLSIVTGSATRLLLTAILWYALDLKSDFEEKGLIAKFPEYATYQATVPSKFLPATIVRELPWMKDK